MKQKLHYLFFCVLMSTLSVVSFGSTDRTVESHLNYESFISLYERNDEIVPPPCDNIDNPGLIGSPQVNCGPFIPATLISVAPASGGGGPPEYLWLKSDTLVPNIPGNPYWQVIPSSTSGDYSPGLISETTYFLRCSRSEGCANYVGESNVIKVEISDVPSLITSSTSESCDLLDGTASVVTEGGVGPFTYLWSNGETTSSITNLVSGDYSVTITDGNGCISTEDVTVGRPPCCNLTNPGAISASQSNCGPFDPAPFVSLLNATGGMGPVEYIWITSNVLVPVIPGGTDWQEIPGANGETYDPGMISETAYFIRCARNQGCTSFIGESNVLTIEVNPASNLVVSSSDETCDTEDGTATATIDGGTAPYTYSWSNGETTSTISGLEAGDYSVTVTDASGCSYNDEVTIGRPPCCNVTNPGVIAASQTRCGEFNPDPFTSLAPASGGIGPVEYVWITSDVLVPVIPGGPDWQVIPGENGETYDPGMTYQTAYFIRCARNEGCTNYIAESNVLSIIVNPESSALISSIDVTCNGQANGSATITVDGGTAPYSYLWSDGQTTATATGLDIGTYSVTVTDVNGCEVVEEAIITEPELLELSVSATGVTCDGEGVDGTASTSVSGGTLPYVYLWSNGATTSSVSGLVAGDYIVTVTDGNGCEVIEEIIIDRPPCCNVTNPGLIQANQSNCGPFDPELLTSVLPATGGIGPAEYVWISSDVLVPVTPSGTDWQVIPGATGETYDPGMISETTYFIRCARNEGCDNYIAESNVVTITVHPEPTLILTSIDVACYGESNGSATVSVDGGTAPYSYLWNDGQTTATATGLSIGTYSVTVTDANGCSSSEEIEIGQPTLLTIELTADNALCYGASNGSATASVDGGTAPYSYLWNDGQTTAIASGLSAGTYSVIVTDANGCEIEEEVEIGEPTILTIELTSEDVLCFGGSDGSATASVNGGTAPYSYLWNDGQTTLTATGLLAGTYSVIVTDINGCEIEGEVVVGQPTALTIELTSEDVSCYGGTDGSATASVDGGTASYSYLWNTGATTATATGLSAGIYNVLVTDANGCEIEAEVVVGQPTALTIELTAEDVLCYGGTDGSATASVDGGTAPYSYLWNDGQTTATATGLSAGIYNVLVTDANGCEIEEEVEVGQPTALTIELTAEDVLCYGGSDGSATASLDGGTAAYTYLWNDGQTTATATGLSVGSYSVIATDANGCEIEGEVVVGQPTILELELKSLSVLCYGESNGSATAYVEGGTAPYTYLWIDGQTTATATGLAAGVYRVLVTDANGCEIEEEIEVEQPELLVIELESAAALCYGASNGSAIAFVEGGTAPYSYLWSDGQTTATATGLSAGEYSVVVIDVNGCEVEDEVEVEEPSILELELTSEDVLCYGESNGSATASVDGGTESYSYLWNDGQTTATATGLAAGTYSVIVTDSNGCEIEAEVVVGQPTALTIELTSEDVSCYGGTDGSATASVDGGTASYSYLWNTGATTATVTGLSAGIYNVIVTDANGCEITDEIEVEEAPVLELELSSAEVSCNGGSDGSVTAIVDGGTSPYSYLWNTGATTATVTGLSAGIYNVIVTDANGCEITNEIEVEEAPMLELELASEDVSCYAGTDGSATASVDGGTSPYSYLWNDGQTTATATGLAAGSYNVTVTDANGCEIEEEVVVGQPTELTIELTSEDVSCYEGTDGSATASVDGGTASYSYLWNDGQTTATATGLSAGAHSVIVTDANGCEIEGEVVVGQPTALTIELTADNALCYGASNGSATASVDGGTAPYSYLWNDGQTTVTATGLSAGTYSVIVTDANGCEIEEEVEIVEPTILTIDLTSEDVSCYGGTDGSATASVDGGTTSYSYLWNTGATTATVTGLTAGTYSVIVTDANGCEIEGEVVVGQPTALTIDLTSEDVSCYAGTDGSATASVDGGTASYSYLWNDGQTTATATGLSAGTYSVIVTDANGCEIEGEVVVGQPTALTIELTSEDVSCYAGTDGSATASVDGGTAPYSYLWNDGQTTVTATGLSAGTYSVIVTDINGCEIEGEVVVGQPTALTIEFTSEDVSCYAGTDGSATASVDGGTASYSYLWNTGATTATVTGLTAGTYSVIVTDANGCEIEGEVVVGQPTALTIELTSEDVLCYAGTDGSATASVDGGTASYSYLWNDGQTTGTATGLSAGTYSVIVTDANGCEIEGEVVVGQPTTLTIDLTSEDVSCYEGTDGSATVSVDGGTASYSYLWNDGQTTATATGLSAGIYNVVVTDANGCEIEGEVVVGQPTALTIDLTSEDVSCYEGTDGSVTASVDGGTATYSYLWNTGATTATVTGLTAGTYSVIVTDANGCEIEGEVVVGQPTALTIELTSEDVSCYGGTDGSVTASIDGGTATYSYLWNTGATTATVTGLTAGTYSVIVTDANGCEIEGEVVVGQPTALTIELTSEGISCHGESDGSATASADGGTAPYSYLWNDGQTTATITGLSVGTYSVIITDANGCEVSNEIELEQPELLHALVMTTDALCSGVENGTGTAYVSGGVEPYTYNWVQDGVTVSTINPATTLVVGSGILTVTDANGCTALASFMVYGPPALVLTLTSEDVSCYGGSDGSATVSVDGGDAPYTYSWSTGATTATVTGLTAGTYSVTVTDANGCYTSDEVEIEQPSMLELEFTSEDVSCYGGTDGSATASVDGGTASYSYLWNTGATTATVTGLTAGTYSVIVTDANGCEIEGEVVVGQPTALTIELTSEDVSCYGGTDGSVTASIDGGTATYSYLWNTGATTATVTGLTAGTYSVIVTDANGCEIEGEVVVGQPTALTIELTSEDVSCYGGTDGSVTASVDGGTATYSYLWNTGATTATVTGLTAGTYSVIVTDANGCEIEGEVVVGQPTALTIELTSEDVSCYGGTDGSATASVDGGTASYSYLWNDGQTTATATGLSAGTYSVIVTDANGCEIEGEVVVGQPTALTIDLTSEDVSCYGGTDGSATASVDGGTASYSYLWNDGQTTATATGLSAGTYSVIVTDANGCEIEGEVVVGQPTVLTIELTSEDVSCYAGTDGSVTASVDGGTASYSYLWNTGATTATVTGLTAGTYSVIVTDANGCEIEGEVVVGQPTALTIELTSEDVSCYAGTDGSVTASVDGGTASYSYLWNTGATTATVTGLTAGTYSVIVTDANGCEIEGEVVVGQPTALTIELTSEDVSCYGGTDGSATASVDGGTASYSYLWNTGATTATVTGLTAGTYSVIVTDANGCEIEGEVVVGQPTALTIDLTSEDVLCYAGTDGSATASVDGGTASYSYLWNTGATTATVTGLTAGTYSVIVTDANGCEIEGEVVVGQPTALTIDLTSEDVLCYAGTDGSATASVDGGTASYSYLWNTGATTATVTGLTAGTYSVIVTDANGCEIEGEVVVGQPTALTIDLTSEDVLCYAGTDGSATASVDGGTASYSYLWNDGQTTATATGLSAGTYSVIVTDANGCEIEGEVVVGQPTALTIELTSEDVLCYEGVDGSATASVDGGTAPYTYLWSDGQTTATATGLAAGTYNVTVTDANGCEIADEVEVEQPTMLEVIVYSELVGCYGGADGTAGVGAMGGTAPYTYLWSNGETTPMITGLIAGVYSVVVTDANGCDISEEVEVEQPPMLVLDLTAESITCNGEANGSATVAVSGGTAPYNYIWSTGESTATITGLVVGTYSVAVTDANGCQIDGEVVIEEPEFLHSFVTVSDVSCYGDTNGAGEAFVSGGVAPYTYDWVQDGATVATENPAATLEGGFGILTVTDANGCESFASFVVGSPAAELLVSVASEDIACYGDNNGVAAASVTGGTSEYSYSWDNGETTATIENLLPGDYNLIVTDANGCEVSEEVTILESNEVIIQVETSIDDICGGTITVASIGGVAPYTYDWAHGATGSTLTDLCDGIYTVTVTDANGCSTEVEVALFPQVLPGVVHIGIAPNPIFYAGSISLRTEVNIDISVNILNDRGQIVEKDLFVGNTGENGTVKFDIDANHIPRGLYFVSVITKYGVTMEKFIVQ